MGITDITDDFPCHELFHTLSKFLLILDLEGLWRCYVCLAYLLDKCYSDTFLREMREKYSFKKKRTQKQLNVFSRNTCFTTFYAR